MKGMQSKIDALSSDLQGRANAHSSDMHGRVDLVEGKVDSVKSKIKELKDMMSTLMGMTVKHNSELIDKKWRSTLRTESAEEVVYYLINHCYVI